MLFDAVAGGASWVQFDDFVEAPSTRHYLLQLAQVGSDLHLPTTTYLLTYMYIETPPRASLGGLRAVWTWRRGSRHLAKLDVASAVGPRGRS